MLPNLIVIGAMKSGTTSMHHYLGLHPEIFMPQQKELKFFTVENNWHKGLEWYQSWFSGQAKIFGEACGAYTKYPTYTGVPERMHAVIPHAKLIYIVRDPVKRAVSHWLHNYLKRREDRPITEALRNLEGNPYLDCSKYYMQLELYLKVYPEDNILVLTLEALKKHRRPTLQRVFRFLEVDDTFFCPEYSTVFNQSAAKKRRSKTRMFFSKLWGRSQLKRLVPAHVITWYNSLSLSKVDMPVLDEQLKQRLADHLEDDVRRLRAYTGYKFEDWSL